LCLKIIVQEIEPSIKRFENKRKFCQKCCKIWEAALKVCVKFQQSTLLKTADLALAILNYARHFQMWFVAKWRLR
jgi:hypothetical protein